MNDLEIIPCRYCSQFYVMDWKQTPILLRGLYCCDGCYNSHEVCFGCNNLINDFVIYEESIYCKSCFNSYNTICSDCDTLGVTSDFTDVGNSVLCRSCFFEHYFICEDCESTLPRVEECYIESLDRFVCNSCFHRQASRHNRINDDVYVSDTFKNTGNIKRTYGVEIECIEPDGQESPLCEGFEVVDDGSLSEGGKEFKSGILQGDKGLELIKHQCDEFESHEYNVDKSCGLHVHINADDLSELQLLNITSFIVVFEKLIYALLPANRRTGHYSCPLRTNKSDLDYAKQQGARQFDKDSLRNIDRYKGFNLQSVAKHGTIEFRYHSGTINYDKIRHWINLCLRIVEYQKDIFWDRETKYNPNTKKAWKLFYSTLQLNEEQIAYFESRRLKFSNRNAEVLQTG